MQVANKVWYNSQIEVQPMKGLTWFRQYHKTRCSKAAPVGKPGACRVRTRDCLTHLSQHQQNIVSPNQECHYRVPDGTQRPGKSSPKVPRLRAFCFVLYRSFKTDDIPMLPCCKGSIPNGQGLLVTWGCFCIKTWVAPCKGLHLAPRHGAARGCTLQRG